MADGLNKVMLLGNLGQDPELKMIGGGQAVLNIRLATTETYLDKSNTRQERTDWHTVTVWGKRAEALAKFLTKGSQIFVEGRIQTRSYEKNGEKRYATDIVANNIILTGRRGGGEARDAGEGAAAASVGRTAAGVVAAAAGAGLRRVSPRTAVVEAVAAGEAEGARAAAVEPNQASTTSRAIRAATTRFRSEREFPNLCRARTARLPLREERSRIN